MNTIESFENKESELNSFSLLDLVLIFLKWKRAILIITGIVCIFTIVLYFFVFDPIFYSVASIRSTGKTSSLLGSLETGIPDISGLDDLGLGAGKSAKELASYEEIITSRRCIEPLIIKFDILNREEYRFMEDAIKDFSKSRLILDKNTVAGILKVGVYDKDPQIAKDMLDFLLSELDKINVEINITNAKNNRVFIEKRYLQARNDLAKSEDSMKSFQVIYGISPDLQVKAAAQSEFTFAAELKMEEVKLDVLKKILSPDQIEVKTQEQKIASMKNKMAEIQNSTDLNEVLRLGNSPQIVLSFFRLQREIEIQSKILSFLLPLYEQAKIEEQKETPTVIILDKPYVAEKKSKPKRLTMVLVFTLIGFVGANMFFVLKWKLGLWRVRISSLSKSKKLID